MSHPKANMDLWNSLSPDLIGVLVAGKIVFVNTAGAKLLGAASPDQVVGKPILDFVHPDCRGTCARRIQQIAKEETEVTLCREKWIRLDGTTIEIEMAAISLLFHGKPAVQFIARCITHASS